MTSTEPPAVNAIFHGTVRSIQQYGCFVRLPGYRRDGLVHISDLLPKGSPRVERVEDVVSANQMVWVKVIHVFSDPNNPHQMKLKLSMGAVDQESGVDLDPEHLQTVAAAASGGGGGMAGPRSSGPQSSEPPPYVLSPPW